VSNNAHFVDKDENGKFFNATSEPKFLESLQWVVSLMEKGYEKPVEEGANWDWFVAAFHDGQVAMTFAEQYKVGTWKDMADDWGFVVCPKGPKSDGKYGVDFVDNVGVIPASFDKETAEKIAFAYNLWTDPIPGFDDPDAWKDGYYVNFRDARAVDETLVLMYDDSKVVVNNDSIRFVYGLDFGDIIWDTYGRVKTPAEKIEEVAPSWQALIDEANK
jgi:ABC-type glycerol-3-phosphate transport system substrate-binding protein